MWSADSADSVAPRLDQASGPDRGTGGRGTNGSLVVLFQHFSVSAFQGLPLISVSICVHLWLIPPALVCGLLFKSRAILLPFPPLAVLRAPFRPPGMLAPPVGPSQPTTPRTIHVNAPLTPAGADQLCLQPPLQRLGFRFVQICPNLHKNFVVRAV